jgi:hypothetical protein
MAITLHPFYTRPDRIALWFFLTSGLDASQTEAGVWPSLVLAGKNSCHTKTYADNITYVNTHIVSTCHIPKPSLESNDDFKSRVIQIGRLNLLATWYYSPAKLENIEADLVINYRKCPAILPFQREI